MSLLLELYGNLVLTFIGFVVPIVGTVLSIFHQGISILAEQYKNEKEQTEKNIKEQLKKMAGQEGDLEEKDVQINLDKLKSISRTAENKLSLLNPNKQIIRLFVPFVVTFILIETAVFYLDRTFFIKGFKIYYSNLSALLSLLFFAYGLFALWEISKIVIEIKKAADDRSDKSEREDKKTLFSLLEISQKGTGDFLKKVFISINGMKIENGKPTIFTKAQEKCPLNLGIWNTESRMAKNIEIGLIFPQDFIIEKTSSYSVYNDGSSQIVRDTDDSLHANTHLRISEPLVVTPLKQGDLSIKTFVKGENVETAYRNFELKVS